MAEKKENLQGLTVKKSVDFSEWYNQVVLKAGLADYAPVRGFMVIMPSGYALWEQVQRGLDRAFARLGAKNAYFPLLIPESFFRKEAEHAKGFAPELAWIEREADGERVAIRPTSETIIYSFFAKWIRSWRDLPFRVNQWCNVLRWEVKQTKLFLRTREFLWQEGHCAYATEKECVDEALVVLEEYEKFCQDVLAIPVVAGVKTETERFAGAKDTFTVEALMPDGRALQMGTSHNLGQNFARTFGVKFLDESGAEQLVWQNSWGVSTRLIGALVMVHGDDKGLVIPPRIALQKAVIVPIIFGDSKKVVLEAANKLAGELREFGVFVDDRDQYSSGWKFNEWELNGIPLRIEIGPRDVKSGSCVIVRRDTGEKKTVLLADAKKTVEKSLGEIQENLFSAAKNFLDKNTAEANSWKELEKAIEGRKLVLAPFCGSGECEKKIKEKTTATSRCIQFNQGPAKSKCVVCGKPADKKGFFAKSY